MVRADGGGRQKVNVALARPKEIRNIRWTAVNATFVNADGHEVAFANSDGHRWDEHWELEFVRPRSLIRVDQQWSFTEMGFTKRRLRYTQTYDNIVLHIEFKNGGSDQKVVELAKFGEHVLIRSGEARLVGWSRLVLYSGLTILPRSVYWSANFNSRSDNTDVMSLPARQNDEYSSINRKWLDNNADSLFATFLFDSSYSFLRRTVSGNTILASPSSFR